MPKSSRSYAVIWERIRADPDKNVPVDVVNAFVDRVHRQVRDEKHGDTFYRDQRLQQGKTGILYISRSKHPTNSNLTRVTFLLREFNTTTHSDTQYLRKYPPLADIKSLLGFESLEAITFGKDTHEFGRI